MNYIQTWLLQLNFKFWKDAINRNQISHDNDDNAHDMSPCQTQFDEVLVMLSKSHARASLLLIARTPAYAPRRFPWLSMCAFIRLHTHTLHTHSHTRRNTRTNCMHHLTWLHLVYANGNFRQLCMFTKLRAAMCARAQFVHVTSRKPCTTHKTIAHAGQYRVHDARAH